MLGTLFVLMGLGVACLFLACDTLTKVLERAFDCISKKVNRIREKDMNRQERGA